MYWSTDRATVGLIVKGGVIVGAPPYAKEWALGRTVTELPPAKESYFVTDTNVPDAEGVDWGGAQAADAVPYDEAVLRPVYPEFADNPHNHRYTISLAPDKPPFIAVRGNTAAEITAALQELEDFGVYANLAAAWASLKVQGTIGAGLGPVTAMPPQAAPPGPPQGQYAPPPAQGGGWSGGGPQEKPRPAGWAMVDVPFNDKDRFKGLRAQGTETGNYLRGKIQWGGKGVYWLEPSIAGWLAQQGFPVTQ